MPKVRVGDVELFYAEAGAGDPVVLIMGFGGDHVAWGFQTPVFAERYRVIAFDNRGAGQSDCPDVPYTTRQMAEDTVGLLDALSIERAHVIGCSMGGLIAQELALNHPGRVRSLQLHCTYGRPDRALFALMDAWRTIRPALSAEEWMRTVCVWLFAARTYNERPSFVETVVQTALANPNPFSLTGFRRQGDALRTHDSLERVKALTCPTLVSGADEDILVPVRFSRELAERIPGAELQIVTGAGHVYFWERPDAFNRMCLEFLDRHRD
ncbi:MAG TPA: alpha/beta fold hydrolase [Methylomirabilota bacterium]|jgi:pimeloyl-ACP methyl ester carboxylesterase